LDRFLLLDIFNRMDCAFFLLKLSGSKFIQLSFIICIEKLYFNIEVALHNQSLNLTEKIMRFYVKAIAGSKVKRPAG
jgi:hypothetical protein